LHALTRIRIGNHNKGELSVLGAFVESCLDVILDECPDILNAPCNAHNMVPGGLTDWHKGDLNSHRSAFDEESGGRADGTAYTCSGTHLNAVHDGVDAWTRVHWLDWRLNRAGIVRNVDFEDRITNQKVLGNKVQDQRVDDRVGKDRIVIASSLGERAG